MAAELKDTYQCLSNIQVRKTAKHHNLHPTSIVQPGHPLSLPIYQPLYLACNTLTNSSRGELEVNGNYHTNSDLNMPGKTCLCEINGFMTQEGLDLEALEKESGLPYVVTDGALHSLTCHKCFNFRMGVLSTATGEDMHNLIPKKRRGSNNGSFEGSLEKIDEDQISSDSVNSPSTNSPSCSSVEKNHLLPNLQNQTSECCQNDYSFNTQNLVNSTMITSLNSSSSTSSPSSSSPSSSLKDFSSLPQINEILHEENSLDSSKYILTVQSEETLLEVDQSQNATLGATNAMEEDSRTDKLSPDENSDTVKPLDSGSLSLPIPFHILKHSSKASKDRNLTDKPPAGPLSSQRSKNRPPPRQSWLLRLFESKMFDMTIAITYLYNSKEPGVQTYIGK